jgi:hypothetical protein
VAWEVARGLRVNEGFEVVQRFRGVTVSRPIHTTLLDLVRTLSAVSDDEQQIVATVTSMVNNGQVVLRGIYAGRRFPTS